MRKLYEETHKEIRKTWQQMWYEKEGRERHLESLKTIPGRAQKLFNAAQGSANRRGLPFTITVDIVADHLSKCKCEVTGMTLDFSVRSRNPFAPSLDQKRPGKGYTPDNIQIVCWWYNRLKGDLSDKETKSIIKKIQQIEEF